MSRVSYIMATIVAAALFSGCAVKQQIGLDHHVVEKPSAKSYPAVSLDIQDNREYIMNGKKEESFIGLYRGGFGNPWDVNTEDNIPLAKLFAIDLTEELTSLGFINEGSSKSLIVSINKWKFDTYQNIKFDYDLDVTVVDLSKNVLAQNKILDSVHIKGSFWTGPKGAAEREIPKIYNEIISKILRENRDVLQALK